MSAFLSLLDYLAWNDHIIIPSRGQVLYFRFIPCFFAYRAANEFLGAVIVSLLQQRNASSPIVVTLSGMVMLVSESQFLKAYPSIRVTL